MGSSGETYRPLEYYNRTSAGIKLTLRVDADGKKKTSRLVWMTPE